MASLLIRRLDEDLKRRLRVQAAENGRSMEEEARQVLAAGLGGTRGAPSRQGAAAVEGNIAALIRSIVEPEGGLELDLPLRSEEWSPPRLDDDRQ